MGKRCSALQTFSIGTAVIFLAPSSAWIHMDAPVASKLIVISHQNLDGLYFNHHGQAYKGCHLVSQSDIQNKSGKSLLPLQKKDFASAFSVRESYLNKLVISEKGEYARIRVCPLPLPAVLPCFCMPEFGLVTVSTVALPKGMGTWANTETNRGRALLHVVYFAVNTQVHFLTLQ